MPDHPPGFHCVQCGACCRAYVQVTERDVLLWASVRRLDIMRAVSPVEGWIEPRTRDGEAACPFRRDGTRPGTYICRIYDLRPQACRRVPASRAQAERVGCSGFEEDA